MITLEKLEKSGACKEALIRFREIEHLPQTVELAVENAEYFQWGWAASAFLNGFNYSRFNVSRSALIGSIKRADSCDAAYKEYLIGVAKLFATLYLEQEEEKKCVSRMMLTGSRK